MALPADFPIVSPTTWVQSGIVVSIVPSWSNRASNGEPATNFVVELQRAPDSSGVPGTPVTIANLPPIPRTGAFYTDTLPFDGAKRYYRFRHIRTGWTAGAWSPYTRGAIPVFLDALIPVNPTGPIPIPTMGDGSADPTALDPGSTVTFGPTGRVQLFFNGDIELGLAYWLGTDVVTLDGNLTNIIANDPLVNLQLDTTSQYGGTQSIKLTSSTTLANVAAQVDRASNDLGQSRLLFFRAQAGDVYRGRLVAKASNATNSGVFVRLYCFDKNKAIILSSVFPVESGSNVPTSYTVYEGEAVALPANTVYVAGFFGAYVQASGGIDFTFDDISVWRQSRASDLAGTIAPPTIDGWYQDDVIASQTNVELTRAMGRWRATQAGSVTGVVATMTEARTAGTLTVTVFKNTGLAGATGASVGLTAVIDGTNTSRKATTQAKDLDTFVAGDELYLVITTDGSWTPTTSDLRAALEMEI